MRRLLGCVAFGVLMTLARDVHGIGFLPADPYSLAKSARATVLGRVERLTEDKVRIVVEERLVGNAPDRIDALADRRHLAQVRVGQRVIAAMKDDIGFRLLTHEYDGKVVPPRVVARAVRWVFRLVRDQSCRGDTGRRDCIIEGLDAPTLYEKSLALAGTCGPPKAQYGPEIEKRVAKLAVCGESRVHASAALALYCASPLMRLQRALVLLKCDSRLLQDIAYDLSFRDGCPSTQEFHDAATAPARRGELSQEMEACVRARLEELGE